MIIDFHTHVFPDRIAERTISHLSEKCSIPPFSDGTVNGLLSEMKKAGVDISVTFPVITNPTHFDSVNRFAAEINQTFSDKAQRLISFAGIHPACEDIEGKMRFIRDSGFLGVKIHPDYQEAYITDDGYIKIMKYAMEYDLIVITHSGVDAGYRDKPVRCTPEGVLQLIKKIPHSKLVLAHYGANEMFDEVLDTLAGENVYFDTAYMLRFIDEGIFKKILEKHGEERILFASDSPWSSIKGDLDILRSFALDERAERKILFENSRKLLKM